MSIEVGDMGVGAEKYRYRGAVSVGNNLSKDRLNGSILYLFYWMPNDSFPFLGNNSSCI